MGQRGLLVVTLLLRVSPYVFARIFFFPSIDLRNSHTGSLCCCMGTYIIADKQCNTGDINTCSLLVQACLLNECCNWFAWRLFRKYPTKTHASEVNASIAFQYGNTVSLIDLFFLCCSAYILSIINSVEKWAFSNSYMLPDIYHSCRFYNEWAFSNSCT